MNNPIATFALAATMLAGASCINAAHAQTADVQEAVDVVMQQRLPYEKEQLTLADPVLGKVDIALDVPSFGTKAKEVEYSANEIANAREAIVDLTNRSAAKKNALVKQLKKVTLRLVPTKAQRGVSFKNGVLLICSESFENDYLSANDIMEVLGKSL